MNKSSLYAIFSFLSFSATFVHFILERICYFQSLSPIRAFLVFCVHYGVFGGEVLFFLTLLHSVASLGHDTPDAISNNCEPFGEISNLKISYNVVQVFTRHIWCVAAFMLSCVESAKLNVFDKNPSAAEVFFCRVFIYSFWTLF